MPKMRAKVYVQNVIDNRYADKEGGEKVLGSQTLIMYAVARKGSYPPDGSDEDNTYAKFSPSGRFELTVANPALFEQFAPGQTYYVDFTPADA